MADEKTPDTSGESTPSTGLHVYKPERELHYESEVDQMIDYEATITDPDERPAYTIIVPEKEVGKHKRWFNESAKDRKRTVRAVNTRKHGDGFAAVEFVLRPTTKTETAEQDAAGATSDATPEVTEKETPEKDADVAA
jgi:hypothetical protein